MPATATSASSPAAPRSFAAFVAADQVASVRKAAEEAGFRNARVVPGTVAEAVRHLGSQPTPDQLVVDLSGSADVLAAIGALAEVCDVGTRVIALGHVNDVDLYRALVRQGVQDYLVKPVSVEAMRLALSVGQLAAEAAAGGGKLIAIIGTRGGVGATSLACNLAWALANEQQMRTALVDLDLFFGSCALTLDLETGRSFREAMENPARIDSLFIERSMVRESEKLYVLSSEEALDAPFAFDATAIDTLLQHLRRDFQSVVIDFPRFALRQQAHVLKQPATAVLVSDGTLAGMRDTQRLGRVLKSAVPATNVCVCLNRVGVGGAGELATADFEKGAEARVELKIAYDVKAFAACSATGKPLLKAAPGSRGAAGVRTLAARFGRPQTRTGSLATLRRLWEGRR